MQADKLWEFPIKEFHNADEHLEALMLEVLAEFQVTIPELVTPPPTRGGVR